jgi:drug/metabolite transporter (DMT)-like permease
MKNIIKSKTKLWAIGLVLICTLLTSFGQIFLKFGSDALSLDLSNILTNYYLMIGLVLYAFGAMLLIFALKGGELSVVYPFIATSFIWVSIFSQIFLGESMGILKWAGILAIVMGVIFIKRGDRS